MLDVYNLLYGRYEFSHHIGNNEIRNQDGGELSF